MIYQALNLLAIKIKIIQFYFGLPIAASLVVQGNCSDYANSFFRMHNEGSRQPKILTNFDATTLTFFIIKKCQVKK